jgi:hypothetical protein
MRYGLVSISVAILLTFALTTARAQAPSPAPTPGLCPEGITQSPPGRACTPGPGRAMIQKLPAQCPPGVTGACFKVKVMEANRTFTTPPQPPLPKWCSPVPESPPPPRWNAKVWAGEYEFCSSLIPWADRSKWEGCMHACDAAAGDWGTSNNPPPKKIYQSTNKQQGPFHLPGGTTGYILPLPGSTAAPAATPAGPQGRSDPGGPIPGIFFEGPYFNETANGQPPDVAADVSPAENAEFLNEGLYVTTSRAALRCGPPRSATSGVPAAARIRCRDVERPIA